MSRNLPVRPNLEYLKKEAKALLEVLQQQNAAAKLADAQHALSGEPVPAGHDRHRRADRDRARPRVRGVE